MAEFLDTTKIKDEKLSSPANGGPEWLFGTGAQAINLLETESIPLEPSSTGSAKRNSSSNPEVNMSGH